MTYAPQTLLEARHVIREHTGLSVIEVGIAPDPAHNGGYHCGWDKRRIVNGKLSDYSWNESPRDWNHKTDAASAIDIGWFDKLTDGRQVSLIDFNVWLVHECAIGAPDTLDIREVIYTTDRKTVKRWDRLGKRDTGDNSHLDHTHVSRFRDAENKPFAPLFRRFFEQGREEMKTGLVRAINGDGRIWLSDGIVRVHVANHDDTDQTQDEETVLRDVRWVNGANVLGTLIGLNIQEVGDLDAWGKELPADLADRMTALENKLSSLDTKMDAMMEKLNSMGAGPFTHATITGGELQFGEVS